MKEEVVDEVLEVEVEETVKETVKEEVAEEKALGTGQSQRVFLGSGRRGPSRTCHGTPPSWPAPTPQTSTTPSLSPRRVRFGLSVFDAPCGSQIFGAGEVGTGGRGGGVHRDKPLRVGGGFHGPGAGN